MWRWREAQTTLTAPTSGSEQSTPGSVADKCGILRVGDELVQIDRQLVVGATHREATEAIGLIDKPTTLAVQRHQDLNLLDRFQIKTD